MYAGTVIPPASIIDKSEIIHSGLFSEINKHLSPFELFSNFTGNFEISCLNIFPSKVFGSFRLDKKILSFVELCIVQKIAQLNYYNFLKSYSFGGQRETRTLTVLLPLDFESNASTGSAIPIKKYLLIINSIKIINIIKVNMFRKLYNKTIEVAGNKNSKFLLGGISFVESFIFPIPPDVVIIPMTIAKPKIGLK